MARLFTADPHWGHYNIIKYCGRPFPDVPSMNKKLKENWNKVVNENDDVYICGDWSMLPLESIRKINESLKGNKHLILGNHDEEKWSDYIRVGFTSVQRYVFLNIAGIGPVGLAHDPSCCIVDQTVPWLCGHLHQQFEKMNNCINVGVDVRNFTPIKETELIPLLELTKKFHMKLDPNARKEFHSEFMVK